MELAYKVERLRVTIAVCNVWPHLMYLTGPLTVPVKKQHICQQHLPQQFRQYQRFHQHPPQHLVICRHHPQWKLCHHHPPPHYIYQHPSPHIRHRKQQIHLQR